jgi:hypothetical protein
MRQKLGFYIPEDGILHYEDGFLVILAVSRLQCTLNTFRSFFVTNGFSIHQKAMCIILRPNYLLSLLKQLLLRQVAGCKVLEGPNSILSQDQEDCIHHCCLLSNKHSANRPIVKLVIRIDLLQRFGIIIHMCLVSSSSRHNNHRLVINSGPFITARNNNFNNPPSKEWNIPVFSYYPRLTAVGIGCVDHAAHLYQINLALIYTTSGGRSVIVVRLRTKSHRVFICCYYISTVMCYFHSLKIMISSALERWGMASSGMLRRVALVRTDVSVELSASLIRVTRIGELETTLAVTINWRTLRRNTKSCYLVFLRSVRRLLVTASILPSSPFLVTLMKEATSSSKTSFLQEPYGVTSQKTPFFIFTAVKSSNLTSKDDRELVSRSFPLSLNVFRRIEREACMFYEFD